jgi:hypothetical protein
LPQRFQIRQAAQVHSEKFIEPEKFSVSSVQSQNEVSNRENDYDRASVSIQGLRQQVQLVIEAASKLPDGLVQSSQFLRFRFGVKRVHAARQ